MPLYIHPYMHLWVCTPKFSPKFAGDHASDVTPLNITMNFKIVDWTKDMEHANFYSHPLYDLGNCE